MAALTQIRGTFYYPWEPFFSGSIRCVLHFMNPTLRIVVKARSLPLTPRDCLSDCGKRGEICRRQESLIQAQQKATIAGFIDHPRERLETSSIACGRRFRRCARWFRRARSFVWCRFSAPAFVRWGGSWRVPVP